MYKRILLILIVLSVFHIHDMPQTQAQICSTGNGAPTTITFINMGSDEASIFGVNFDCQEQFYRAIIPGETYIQETYDGHEWIVRNSDSQELGRGSASSETEIVIEVMGGYIPESPLDFAYRPDENWEWTVIEDSEGCIVRPTTPQDGLDPFYQKMCDYMGISIASSDNAPDLALQAAWNIMANMLQGHSQVVEKLLEVEMRIGIVAQTEGITVLPEYAFLRNDTQTNWDERARGLGGNPFTPLGSGAEENLLCYADDVYFGESIFLHEFAHTMKDGGIILIDPTFNLALTLAYQNAVDTGLWADTYALTNIEEYWAEGVQSYFNTSLETIPTNGIHNDINTREELAEYDPTLYSMIDLLFGGFEWTPVCP